MGKFGYFFKTIWEYIRLVGRGWIAVVITGIIPSGIQIGLDFYNQAYYEAYGEDIGYYIPLVYYVGFWALALVIACFIAFYKMKRLRDKAQQQYTDLITQKLTVVPQAQDNIGIEFYIDRSALASARKILTKELGAMDEVRLAWHSGVTQSNAGFFNNVECKVQSLILTDPKCKTMPELANLTGKELEKMQGEIYTTAREAYMSDIPIWFCRGSIGNSVIIVGNPDKPNSWARVDSVIPYKDVANCTGYRIERDLQPDHFKALFKHYETLLEQCRKPTKEEIRGWKQVQSQMKSKKKR